MRKTIREMLRRLVKKTEHDDEETAQLLDDVQSRIQDDEESKAIVIKNALDLEVMDAAVKFAASSYSASVESAKNSDIYAKLKESMGDDAPDDSMDAIDNFVGSIHAVPFMTSFLAVMLPMIREDESNPSSHDDDEGPDAFMKRLKDLLG